MEIALSFVTVLYTKLRFNYAELLLEITRGVIITVCFLLNCILTLISAFRKLRKPKRCPPIRNKLLLLSATELARKIRRKEVTSEEVVSAFIQRSREVNPVLNAIVQDRFEAALKEARDVDNLLKIENKTEEEFEKNTPLLGVPVTVKESISTQGMSHSVGLKRSTPRIATKNAEVVNKTRLAGGIPLLVSNTPELCFFWETYNNVTGTTRNPYDTRRTPGGSSGGEAALLGSGASVLGLGSDIGGSCRLPAMFCGIFSHKPTPGWISTSGHMPDCSDKNWPHFFCIAPMVRYAEDLRMFLQVISQNPQVANCLSQKVDLKKLKYYYVAHNCHSKVINSVDRDIKSAIKRLTKHLENSHGVIVQQIKFDDLRYDFEFSTTNLLEINGVDSIFTKEADPLVWKSVFFEFLKYLCFLSPHNLYSFLYGMLKRFTQYLPKSFKDRMVEKKHSVKMQFEELLGDNGVLIYPTFPYPATFYYQIYTKVCNVAYMTIFNTLGFPVTQCPMGLNSNGLPIGLQIVAKANCDHLTIAVAEEIEKTFGGWQPPPFEEKVI